MTQLQDFNHELLSLSTGTRSGVPIAIARHSTALGPALGGCRVWQYSSWEDGMKDALQLARAMTLKNAAAGLAHGGGKATVILRRGEVLDGSRRRDVFLDLGDAVEALGGTYITGQDVGTTENDMVVTSERTHHAVGLPTHQGGSGEPAIYTALGVFAALQSALRHVYGDQSVQGRRFAISGLGQVGGRITTMLLREGAHVTVSDIDESKRATATNMGARWAPLSEIHKLPLDGFIPAGIGGVLTDSVIEELDCAVVLGPANNPLAAREGAELLRRRKILYVPDFVANAGGVIYLARTRLGDQTRGIESHIRGLGSVLEDILNVALQNDVTPLEVAENQARERVLASGSNAPDLP